MDWGLDHDPLLEVSAHTFPEDRNHHITITININLNAVPLMYAPLVISITYLKVVKLIVTWVEF